MSILAVRDVGLVDMKVVVGSFRTSSAATPFTRYVPGWDSSCEPFAPIA